MITPKTAKALKILKEYPNISANTFAQFYFQGTPHEILFSACFNQGNGACCGKKVWLCAGSLLGRLAKKGLVFRNIDKYGSIRFRLTCEGEKELIQSDMNLTTIR